MKVSKKKLAWLESLTLACGQHKSRKSGACVMEAVAYVAGEPHTDHPACASRVITRFAVSLNDRWSDARRQALKPYVLRIAGTAADEATERKRAFMCADWAVRECLPLVLEAAKVKEWPDRLRALPAIVDEATAQAGRAAVREARKAAYAAADAAAAADADAAAAAYAAAAWIGGSVATPTSAAYAAADADAAYAYAGVRAKADASALALLDRLIRVTEGA